MASAVALATTTDCRPQSCSNRFCTADQYARSCQTADLVAHGRWDVESGVSHEGKPLLEEASPAEMPFSWQEG